MVALLRDSLPVFEHLVDAAADLGFRVDLQAQRLDALEEVPLGFELRSAGYDARRMTKDVQRTLGGRLRVKLAERACGGIAGIGEQRLAGRGAILVEFLER